MNEEFPQIEIGYCDGLGCGYAAQPCACEMAHESKIEFQRQYNRAWNNNDPECKIWYNAYYHISRRWRNIVRASEVKFYNGLKQHGGVSDFMLAISAGYDEISKKI